MEAGDILITSEEVNKKLPERLKLEKDIIVHEWSHLPPYDCMSAVAIFQKNSTHRLAKADTKLIVNTLEDLTGYEWQVDGVSNFVFHLEDGEI